MSNLNLVQRAFELADSGNYTRVGEIRMALSREGYTLLEMSQLSGKHLVRQLRARMLAASPATPSVYKP
jgi:hypothetical protein